MTLSREQKAALLAVVVLLSVVVPVGFVIGESFLTSFWTSQSGIHLNATNGPEVVTTKDYNIRSGNPFTDKSVNLSTENHGHINISTDDTATSDMVVTVDEINGTTTNVSSITASNGQIQFDPSDKNESSVGGSVTTYKFRGSMAPDDGTTDFIYDASGSPNITVRGDFSADTQYGAVDADTNEGVDVTTATSNGKLVFNELESGNHDIVIQELGTLTLREETEPHELVTGSSATVTFYETSDDSPTIEQRSDDDGDGEIEMTGLPVDEQFAVRVSAPQHQNRTVLIEDLSQQENVFLLNTSDTTSTVDFSIEDPTGQFTSSASSIVVQRAINKSKFDSGGLTWLAIAGDRTGAANELSVTLQDGVRYRLKVSDGDGDTRIVGSYTTTADDAVVLRPTAPDINVTDIDTWDWNATQKNVSGTETIEVEYADPDDQTTNLIVEIYEQGNESNAFTNQTVAGPLGYTKITQTLTDSQAEKNWVVEIHADRDGTSINDKQVVSQNVVVQVPELSPWVQEAISVLVIIMVMALFSVVNVETGAVVTTLVGGGFVFIGWLPAAAGAGVAVALFTALGWSAASRRFA